MSPAQSSRGARKKIDKNALLVAQEITFAKILSGNNEKIRERGIKRLQRWLTARSNSTCPFKENDLKRVWKGLFYCMWMSDKPLVQEEMAESISNLVHCFKNGDACMCFVKCFFHTMITEWRGLDHWRMDKFLMFVRRFMRQVFTYVDQRSWPIKLVKKLGATINSTVLPDHSALSAESHPPLGFSMHFIDIYMDELTKVSKGQLENDELLVALLRPFAVYLSETTERTVGLQIVTQIFDRLIEQSKEGHRFREKYEAWKQLGFPGGNINAIMKVSDGDSDEELDTDNEDDDEEKALDPRAGGVDVELPVARFNPEAVANLLRKYRQAKTSNSWSRRMVTRVISRFSTMKEGKYPLGVKKVAKVPEINFKKLAKESAEDLFDFREKLMKEDDDEWMGNVKKGKEKRTQTVEQKKQTGKKISKQIEEEDDDEDDNVDHDDVDDDEAEDDSDDSEQESDDNDEENGEVDDDVDEQDDDVDVHEQDDDVDIDEQDDDDDVDVDEQEDDVDEQEDDVDNEQEDDDDVDKQEDDDVDEQEDEVFVEKNEEQEDTEDEEECNNKDLSDQCSKDEQVPLGKDNKFVGGALKSPTTPSPTMTNGTSKRARRKLKDKAAVKEEVVIVVRRKRKLADALATPVIQRVKHLKSAQNSPRTPQTPGSAKKLQFILNRNTFQTPLEYDKLLREKPGNPYDSSKKPRYSVLKSTPLASPVNPFYTP